MQRDRGPSSVVLATALGATALGGERAYYFVLSLFEPPARLSSKCSPHFEVGSPATPWSFRVVRLGEEEDRRLGRPGLERKSLLLLDSKRSERWGVRRRADRADGGSSARLEKTRGERGGGRGTWGGGQRVSCITVRWLAKLNAQCAYLAHTRGAYPAHTVGARGARTLQTRDTYTH